MRLVECRRSLWSNGNGNGWNAELGDFSGAEILKAFQLFAVSAPLKKVAFSPNVIQLVRDIDGMQYYSAMIRFRKENTRDSAPCDVGIFTGLDGMCSTVKKGERYRSDRVFVGNLPAESEVRSDTRLLAHEDAISWVSQVRDEFVKFLKENRSRWQIAEDQRETSIMHHSV